MPTGNILGSNIRGFRRRLSMTQEALADKAEMDITYLGQTERKGANLTLAMLEKLASALKVESYVLLLKDAHLEPEKYQKLK